MSRDAPDLDQVRWLDPDLVRDIHRRVVVDQPNLQGEDPTRPVESPLGRVKQQVYYEEVEFDVLRIAAVYAVAISRAHCFVDGNKRTALVSMEVFLGLNGYETSEFDQEKLADLMEAAADNKISDSELHDELSEHLKVVTTDPYSVISVDLETTEGSSEPE